MLEVCGDGTLSDSTSASEFVTPAPEVNAIGGTMEESQLPAGLSEEPSSAEIFFGDISSKTPHDLRRSYRV